MNIRIIDFTPPRKELLLTATSKEESNLLQKLYSLKHENIRIYFSNTGYDGEFEQIGMIIGEDSDIARPIY